MYNPGQPQQPPKKSNKLPLIIGAAVLALVLIGTIIGVAVVRGGDDPVAGGGTGGGGTSSAPPAEAKLPSDAVTGYLEALAAGDATTALTYASTAPSDTTFLTNEVLAASLKSGAITDINVPEVTDKYAYSVAASYKIGSQSVNADIPVEEEGDVWKLREVAYDLTLTSTQNKTLPMLINGVQAEADKVAVFPGTYTFTTGLDNISYGKSNKLDRQERLRLPRRHERHPADHHLGRREGVHQGRQGEHRQVHGLQEDQERQLPEQLQPGHRCAAG